MIGTLTDKLNAFLCKLGIAERVKLVSHLILLSLLNMWIINDVFILAHIVYFLLCFFNIFRVILSFAKL